MIALEGYDFIFSDAEVKQFRQLWDGGIHVSDIATTMNRQEIEVAILILDQREKGHISLRVDGVLGGKTDPTEYGYGRFTYAELERMQNMIERGASNAELATSFAISKDYVNRIKRDMGWTRGYKRSESA